MLKGHDFYGPAQPIKLRPQADTFFRSLEKPHPGLWAGAMNESDPEKGKRVRLFIPLIKHLAWARGGRFFQKITTISEQPNI